jgi:hypothetical protein
MIYKPTHPGKSVRKVIGSHLSKEMGLKDKMGGNIEEFPQELQMRDFPIFNLAE